MDKIPLMTSEELVIEDPAVLSALFDPLRYRILGC
jgi:hypothetical protein